MLWVAIESKKDRCSANDNIVEVADDEGLIMNECKVNEKMRPPRHITSRIIAVNNLHITSG